MTKHTMLHAALALAALGALSSCGVALLETQEGEPVGSAQVTLGYQEDGEDVAVKALGRALTRRAGVARIDLEIQPAGVTDSFNPADGAMSKLYVLPVGVQTFTARAYDAADEEVGLGEAETSILANQTASVYIAVLDTTGPAPNTPHGPVILSLTASKTNPNVNESINLAVTAEDPDGDPLTYAWTADCSDSAFSAPDQPETAWSSSVAQTCRLTATVAAGGLSDSHYVDVIVYEGGGGTGSAQLGGDYVPHPYIYVFGFTDMMNESLFCEVRADNPADRAMTDASCRAHFGGGRYFHVVWCAEFDGAAPQDAQWTFSDDCGGTWFNPSGSSCREVAWQAPNVASGAQICKLTATVELHGLSDSMTAAVVIE